MCDTDRRSFIKTLGAAGVGSFIAGAAAGLHADGGGTAASTPDVVPTRPFGKTGVRVSILGFGGSHDLKSKHLLMRQALKAGVTYWDTAHIYSDSEEAMGGYFERFPEDRKKVFLVTKAPSATPSEMERYLKMSLQRLKTESVDMFFVHKVSDVGRELSKETRAWAEHSKASGRIRFFGFSTHKNMEQCLSAAADMGWIDGIMASYNYRLMHTDAMRRAVDACVKAGIGLTAMKTQAPLFARLYAQVGSEDATARKLTERFVEKGYTEEQAKLKAVWSNEQIACICSEMPNMTILRANVAAAVDGKALSEKDKALLSFYAQQTLAFYCSGCATHCESLPECDLPVSDVMRSLMYAQGYGDKDRGRRSLLRIDPDIAAKLQSTDFGKMEQACPKRLPIAGLMKEAAQLLV